VSRVFPIELWVRDMETKIRIENLSVRYSDGTESLRAITMDIYAQQINVLFGPAGGGKSTLLRTLNRLNDLADVVAQSGHVTLDGEDIMAPGYDVIRLRRRVGIVFARPVPLPMTIYQNITYGLALQPEVILLDEPTSGLDPISTGKVEQTLQELKASYTIVIVPHSVQQAARVADWATFFLQGELVESGPRDQIFTNPQDRRTDEYITGRFG